MKTALSAIPLALALAGGALAAPARKPGNFGTEAWNGVVAAGGLTGSRTPNTALASEAATFEKGEGMAPPAPPPQCASSLGQDRTRLFFDGGCRGWGWFQENLVADGFDLVSVMGNAMKEEGPVTILEDNRRDIVRKRTFRVANRLLRYTHDVNGFPLLDEQVYTTTHFRDTGLVGYTMNHTAQGEMTWDWVDWREITYITGTAYVSCRLDGQCIHAWSKSADGESACESRADLIADHAKGACMVAGLRYSAGISVSASVVVLVGTKAPAPAATTFFGTMGLTIGTTNWICNAVHGGVLERITATCGGETEAEEKKGSLKESSKIDGGGGGGGGGGGPAGGGVGTDGEADDGIDGSSEGSDTTESDSTGTGADTDADTETESGRL